ncbi:MAG: VWA domain-containing protein [Planctomycetes bacterium]|nr:VWA domain-containing protein [Planctomycetota bacterium]
MPPAVLLSLTFEQPRWLLLCLLVPVLVVLSIRSLAGLEGTRRVLALVVRSLVIIVLAMALAGISHVRRSEDLAVMFLMDRSSSIPADQQKAQEHYLQAVSKHAGQHDRIGVIDFARHAFLEQLPQPGYHLEPGRLPPMENPDRTDVAAAIRLAMAMFPHDAAKRIVLLTDGNDNMGDVLAEAANAGSNGVPIDVVPLWYRHTNEVSIERLVAPSQIRAGDQMPLRILIRSEKRARGVIDLYRNGQKLDLPEELATVELEPGNNPFNVVLPIGMDEMGAQRFEARFRPADPSMDQIPNNNVATAFSFISGKGRVLVLSSDLDMDQPLVDALRSENIDVVFKDVSDGPGDAMEMLDYAVIILANVPAHVFTEQQQRSLVSYVRNSGGGLIMTGGDDSFGAGGWIGSPVEDVMPVDFDLKHKRIIPQGALVIIMHSCEINRGNFWGKEVAKKAADTISSRDFLGVVAYSWSPGGINWEVPMRLASNKTAIKQRIDRMQIGDMPDFDPAMRLALNAFQGVARSAAQKHMIILSDGDPSPPSRSVLDALIKAKVTVSTVGIGYGMHVRDASLKQIANRTGGRFYKVMNPNALPQIFVKESKIVRKPLINEEPFMPYLVPGYSDLLPGISLAEGVPELGGLVLTSPKSDSRVRPVLLRKSADGYDPVLVHWQEGMGRSLVFTSGFWRRWGTEWTRWPKFAKLWAQMVRYCMRQEATADFETFVKMDGDRAHVGFEALSADASYLDTLVCRGNVIRPDQTAVPITITQTAPGRYQADFPIDQTGQYIVNIAVSSGSESMGVLHIGLSMPFSPEYRERSTNETLLRQIQDITNGRWLTMNPDTDDVFRHDLPPVEARRPAWEWVIAWLLLPLFLLDVAVRRLASWLAFSIVVEVLLDVFLLFGVGIGVRTGWGIMAVGGTLLLGEAVGWAIRFQYVMPTIGFFTHGVTVLAGRGERSAASLDQLKDRREQVQEERTARGKAIRRPQQTGGAADPPPDPRSKFEAGESTAPLGDLGEALGGAQATPTDDKGKPSTTTPKPGAKDEPAEDATSRLLKAKRRARRDMDDRNQ